MRLFTIRNVTVGAISAIATAIAFVPSLTAAQDNALVSLILSGLPAQESKTYKNLKELSGNAKSRPLEMTKSEMWSVKKGHAAELIKNARRAGVNVFQLDKNWNRTLAPMQKGYKMATEQKLMMHESMKSKAVMGMSMMARPTASVFEYALTKDMQTASTGAPAPTLVIPLNEQTTITAYRTRITNNRTNYIWHGRVQDTNEPVTLLWWPNGRLSGSVTYKGHVFSIRNIGGGMQGVVETSPKALPPEHAPMSPDAMKRMKLKQDPLRNKGDASMARPRSSGDPPPDRKNTPARDNTKKLEDAATGLHKRTPLKLALSLETPAKADPPHTSKEVVVTVLVAYTNAAAAHYANIETDLIALAIEDTNESFRLSGAENVRIELVHAYQNTYVESGSHFDHVFRFADHGDGFMDEMQALRDKHRADVGILIVHDPQGCGLAAQVLAPARRAFAAIHHECAAASYSLAHEIGHLIGARHDLALDDELKPFPYGHGYVHETKWRTMMGYKDNCGGCPRLPVWSNPRLKVQGERAGDALSDNTRVIAEQAARVSGFR
jgi:Metallo-peptidase family M12